MKLIKVFVMFLFSLLAMPINSTVKETKEHLPYFTSIWIENNYHKSLNKKQIDTIVYHVFDKADQHRIDPLFLLSIINTESSFNKNATSRVGAKGLMQVLPKWHKDKIRGRNITDIKVNIEVGTKIISDCLSKHKDNVEKALYCYLGGKSKNYIRKIKNAHTSLRQEVIKQSFLNQLPIEERFDFYNVRQYHDSFKWNSLDSLIASI